MSQEADSLAARQLEELVVTATRTERTMGALPMPVNLIPRSQIRTMGSLRLNDVLTEQTGLVVVPQVNGQGNGIQVQGFNPDYTLILVDGEPLIGRNTGSLELSRVAVGNIKQIEIVKGPSSSLYGSDALAGVINILTERPQGTRASIYSRYGTNQTADLTADAGYANDRLGIYVFGNRYSTNGYDLSPQSFGKTVSPFFNHTVSGKVNYKFRPGTELMVSGRYFQEQQQFDFEVATTPTDKVRTSGQGATQEWNLNPVLTHRFSNRFKLTARFYSTHYNTATNLNLASDNTLYYHDDFQQTFIRPEVNGEYYFNDRNILTVGAGHIDEHVQTSRYGDEAVRKQSTSYGFFQHEWKPWAPFTLIAGGRFDCNTVYGSQFSPKLSARYEISPKFTLRLSGGLGFKSPDFRQLYFNFNNSAAGGYSVLGAEIVQERLAQMDQQGLIQTYYFDPAVLGKLDAERSTAINTGFRYEWKPGHTAELNLFHNSINNLIETQIVAATTAGQNIYSYRNIKRAFTEGVETNMGFPLGKGFTFSLGYQLLFAMDKDVLESVRNGAVYYRDPVTLTTRRLKPSEYTGLYNRSRHMGTVKLFYQSENKRWSGSVRVVYRGRFGIGDIRGNIQGETIPSSDRDNNGILDKYDSFVSGYALVNLSAARTFGSRLRVQAGVDNLLNHKEPIFIPNLPGRLMYASISYSIQQTNKP
ncbi:MAG: TonB-dependent receptor [Cyclobacteriaceae bacterium]|nr:TonB-dependent receptor [Cyclobacteriaceae bacterium]